MGFNVLFVVLTCNTRASDDSVLILNSDGSFKSQPEDGVISESQKPSGLDRLPRLLERIEPVYPKKLRGEGVSGEVVVHFILDERGRVTKAETQSATDPRLNLLAVRTIKKWKFEPGIRNGRPVKTHLQVPINFSLGSRVDRPEVVFAKITKRVDPVYPNTLRRAPFDGEVSVSLLLGPGEDEIRLAHITGSTNSALDDAALLAAMRYEFSPSLRDGKAVSTEFTIGMPFWRDDSRPRDEWLLKRPRKFPSHLPESFHWKTAPRFIWYSPPIFPRSALLEGRSGSVSIRFQVNPDGRVENAEAIGETDIDMQHAAIAAVYNFRFDPAKNNGKPVWAEVNMDFDFNESDESHAAVGPFLESIRSLFLSDPGQIASPSQLDETLKPTVQLAPSLPSNIRATVKGDEIRAACIVDRYGFVRLPYVVSDCDPVVGAVVVHALAAWRFEPPLRNGNAVDCRIVVPFRF